MQAILVKFIGPTDTKPARLKASCAGGSVTIGYHSIDEGQGDKSLYAARMLCIKMDWHAHTLVGGTLPNGDDVFVFGTV